MKMIAGRKEGIGWVSEHERARKLECMSWVFVRLGACESVCLRGCVCGREGLCMGRACVYGRERRGPVCVGARVCVCVFGGRACACVCEDLCVWRECVCGGNVCVDKASERGPRGQDSKPFYVTRWKVLSKGFRQNNLTHQSSWLPSEACSLLWLQQFRSIICRVSSHFLQAVLSTFRSGPQIGQKPYNAALPPLLHQEQCKEHFSFHTSSLV